MKIKLLGPGGAAERDLGTEPLVLATAGERTDAVLALSNGAPFIQPVDNGTPLFIKELDRQRQAARAVELKPNMTLYMNASLLELGVSDPEKIDVERLK